MNYTIRFQDLVAGDLQAVRDYWEQELQASPERILNLILEIIDGLKSFPYIYQRLEDYQVLRRIVVEEYIVLYQVDEERKAVKIEYVYHGSRDLKKVLSRKR